MRLIQFIFSVIIVGCTAGLLVHAILSQETFGQRLAAEIVGGRGRLLRLIEGKKIRANKPTNKQNGKWFCNAADVLKYAQLNFRKPRKRKEAA